MKRISKYWLLFPHPLRWLVTATVGLTLLILGLIFLVLPGPGIPLIIAGLAILATEFAWAEFLLSQAKKQINEVKKKLRKKP